MLRFYTISERRQFSGRPVQLADNFAVKEAVSKAMGTGFRGFGPEDLEVLRDSKGKPYLTLYGPAKQLAEEKGITGFHVSISNTKQLALAFVVAESKEEMP